MSKEAQDERIKEAVREAYGGIAQQVDGSGQRASCCGPGQRSSCCGPAADSAEVVLLDEPLPSSRFYSDDELAGLPETVTGASLGCGNPIAIAGLQPGEVVLDLGSGGGIDCFLAARQVGPEGRVIGLDMTPDMIKLARRNAHKLGVTNVDFRFGEMEEMPLADGSVDVIISNCVINLSPDKEAVFREAYRVLRPGGRVSISDIVVDGDLPQAIRGRLDAWAGCIAGALDEGVYLNLMRAAGFERIEVVSRDYAEVEGAEAAQMLAEDGDGAAEALLAETGLTPQALAHRIASIKVRAYKAG
ncbi:MAG: arsenite methyltransferase [Anaerolineae bacterium]|nr:arsenite methyltransferase [Anaerolineae bacterium]